jgi:hypothetical protein
VVAEARSGYDLGMMRSHRLRLSIVLAAGALFASIGCDSGSTDDVCNEACNIWQTECTWDFQTCFAQCKSEDDWGGVYLDCLRNADSCTEIETTCEFL